MENISLMKYITTLFIILSGLLVHGIVQAYPSYSPYAYSVCNPVNCIDPDGRRPIYSMRGYLLGTDDNGLHGDAIIMDSQYFHQGMSPEEALKYHLGMAGLVDSDAVSRFNNSFNTLSLRPDWDGYLTLDEDNDWYRNGNGQSLYVSLEKIDLSGLVSPIDVNMEGKKVVNLFKVSNSMNDALVYGQITLKRYPNDMVRAYADNYEFGMHPWNSIPEVLRNIGTVIGKTVAGRGVEYKIHIYGSKQLKSVVH